MLMPRIDDRQEAFEKVCQSCALVGRGCQDFFVIERSARQAGGAVCNQGNGCALHASSVGRVNLSSGGHSDGVAAP